MANFNDVVAEIKSGATSKKTFSRSDFDKLAKAYVNDVNYDAKVGQEGKELKSVELFRGMIKRILKDFGVDEQEASRVMTDAYQIKNVDGVYELCSELIYNYTDAGKKFQFLEKPDFTGSLILNDVEESVKETKGVNSDDVYVVTKKKHKQIKAQSKAPKWLKDTVKK